ncbi:secreted protein [Candidatus Magnetobacterium bavaricum]|uniref:Secreted protein n=1 Tax=Candidatus Magnetobacterium bavaricum TaxID=29290 RepID=A0A0F3GM66_9BACT|nr:secreted protein [Candidatus Magnetobacterium bavaricum]
MREIMQRKKTQGDKTMFSKRITSITCLLTLVVFVCVSCVSAPVRSGGGQERFYKGQRAGVIDILRESREEMLNGNLDRAKTLATEAKEKSETNKDNVMRLSCTLWMSMISMLMKDTKKPVDYSSMDFLKDEDFETLFRGYLLVMYDLNAFDLKDKRLPGALLNLSLSDKELIDKGNLIADGLRKGGQGRLADLVEVLFKSYAGLIKTATDHNSSDVSQYKRKILSASDEIVSLTDNPMMAKEMSSVLKMLALYLKLIVVGSDRDMETYEKTAKKFAVVFSSLQVM